MLGMLAAIPATTVLPCDAEQSSTALTAVMGPRFRAQRRCNAVDGIFPKFCDKGRRPRIGGQNCQRVTGPRHGDIRYTPLFRVF